MADSIEQFVARLRPAAFVPAGRPELREQIGAALTAFLAALPAERLAAVRAACDDGQPGGGEPGLVRLLRACPTLHKFAQVLARHRELDPAVRALLTPLESMPCRLDAAALTALAHGAVGEALAAHDVVLDCGAAVEASVAVVVPLAWGRDGPRRAGVLKLLKPAVVEQIDQEWAGLASAADGLDAAAARGRLPALGYRAAFDEARALLLHEVRLDQEQAHLAEAARHFVRPGAVVVPALLPFSTPRATAMEYVAGVKITDAPRDAALRRRLAERVLRALVAGPFLSRDERAFFHADPHAGNLLATPDGQVAILDWSLVGRLGVGPREAVAQMILGGLLCDAGQVARALAALGTPPDATATGAVIDAALTDVSRGQLPGLDWVVSLLDRLAAAGARFAGELLLFRKVLLTLEGVVADIDATCGCDAVLLAATMDALLREWPARFFAPPQSRAFATHLSNLDLAALAMRFPAAAWLHGARALRPAGPG
ncbi:MAG: AarF/UbiB family protein [Phycisphaerae bacterium]